MSIALGAMMNRKTAGSLRRRELKLQLERAAQSQATLIRQSEEMRQQRDALQSQTVQLQAQAEELEAQRGELQAQTIQLEGTLDELRESSDKHYALAEESRLLSRRLAEAQHVAQIGYWEIDAATGSVFWSAEMYRLCGLEPGIQPPPTDYYLTRVHPDDRQLMQDVAARALDRLQPFTAQYRLQVPQRKTQTVQAQGRVIVDAAGNKKLIGTVQNITERVQLEAQLRQSQKMEALGTLAGGVAHDFNNILSVIMGFGGILLADTPPDAPGHAELTEILKAAERAGGLTRQLLAFSHQQTLAPRPLSINAVVTEVERMLSRLIPATVVLSTHLDPEIATIQADSGQLEQVLLNLTVNARDAMPDGGTLTIETANVVLEEHQPPLPPDGRGGRYVMLVVADSGIGMDDAVRSRIFEPFFTTKEQGKGTGLGLATVYGIVQQSGGHIWVYSEPAHGTTFKMYFPVIDAGVPAAPTANGARPQTRFGGETILLAEDDTQVRAAARKILESARYRVLESANGRDALDVFRSRHAEIDLVITDMIMPDMNGRQLAEQLRAVRGDIPLLFISGYTDDTVLRRSLMESGTMFLQKPFSIEALTAKVRQALDGGIAAALQENAQT